MWDNLKASIASVVRTNNNQEITGANLQNVLNTIVNTVGANATFAGIAVPSTNPGTPDGPVFYIACEPGVYSNFNLTLVDGLYILENKTGSWVGTLINTGAAFEALIGYYNAVMIGASITVPDATTYRLTVGGDFKLKMLAPGTTATTLTIGNATDIPIWYNGAAVSAQNTWEADEIISVFYDGTRFMASNSQGGGGKAEKIKYDNSQSGLAAENVQEALDEIEEKAVVYIPTGFYIPSDSSVSAWFTDSWLTTNNRHSFVVPRNPSWQRMKVTANPNYFSKIGFLDNTYTEPINGHSSEFISSHSIAPGTSKELNIPTNCAYIAIAASPSSATSTEYLPVGIEMFEINTSHQKESENIADTTYTYPSNGYKTIFLNPIDNYERVRVRVIITNGITPNVAATLLEIMATYDGVSTNVFRNYGTSIHDADIILSGDKLSRISVGGNMKQNSVARVIIDGYGAMGEIDKLAEEVAISIPNSPSAYVAGNGKWVTSNANYKGVFVNVLPNTAYRIVANQNTNSLYAILTSNSYTGGEYISTFADGEYIRRLPAGQEQVFVTPADANYINVGYIVNGTTYPPTLYKNGMSVINDTISNANNIKGVYQDAVIVAAFNAPASIKEIADFVCDGVNDEAEIQQAVNACQSLSHGGKVLLSSGIFYIEDFPNTEANNANGDKIAIKINDNNSPINIIGDTNPYSFTDSNRYVKGTILMVSSTCYENLDSNKTYKIFGSDFVDRIAGNSTIDFRISNMRIQVPWNQKKIIGIDCRSFNRTVIDTVYVSCVLNGYNGWNYSYGGNTHYPDVPVEGSIGIRMMGGSNSDHKNTYKNVMSQGFYEGFAVGGDDILMEHCQSYWCVYPYTFGNYEWKGGFCQPIVMISCAQYKCTNLPLFVDNGFISGNTHYTGNQEVVMIAYHGEHILTGADAPGGVIGVAAKETTNKMFRGYIDYGIRTSSSGDFALQSDPKLLFWQHGYGEGFITRNNAHLPAYTTSDRNSKMKGNYLEKVFDLTLGKEVVCIDTENQTWVDANGNVV